MLSDVAASLRLQSVIESSAQAAGLEPRSTPARRLVLV
jgi:hypothetical protein